MPGTVSTLPAIYVGSIVEIVPRLAGQWAGVPFKVTKVNPKTYTLKTEDGRGVKAGHGIVTKSDKPFTDKALEQALDQGPLDLGSLVTVDSAKARLRGWSYPAGQRFVVLADKVDKVRVVKLGGDGGRYWNLPRTILTPAEVTNE